MKGGRTEARAASKVFACFLLFSWFPYSLGLSQYCCPVELPKELHRDLVEKSENSATLNVVLRNEFSASYLSTLPSFTA